MPNRLDFSPGSILFKIHGKKISRYRISYILRLINCRNPLRHIGFALWVPFLFLCRYRRTGPPGDDRRHCPSAYQGAQRPAGTGGRLCALFCRPHHWRLSHLGIWLSLECCRNWGKGRHHLRPYRGFGSRWYTVIGANLFSSPLLSGAVQLICCQRKGVFLWKML